MVEVNPYNVKPTFPDKYYVYALCKPDGTVFYVGKGKGKRINHHFNEYHLKKSTNKKNQTIRKYGNSIKREILCYFDSEDSAYDYEEWLISHYGLESEGGQLRQYAKTRNQYSDSFSKKMSHNSQKKTTSEQEVLVRDAYIMYFTDCVEKSLIAEKLDIKYSRLVSWLSGKKHKHLYEKYITSGLVKKNKEYKPERQYHKLYDIELLKSLRQRWVDGESTGVLARIAGMGTSTLKDLFVGNSSRGLFDNYETFPKRYLKRKNRGKWLEDKTC